MELCELSAAEIADGVRARKFSTSEVVGSFLACVEKADPGLGAMLHVSVGHIKTQARRVDAKVYGRDDPGPLAGVPIGIKDVFATRGLPTTCGSKILEGWVPSYDATVVRRLRLAGGVVAGKTNCDEFAMGSSTENSAYKPCRNPWDKSRVPGGSSGGSAAGVAARYFPGALGTDTGGSIRQPAALCGVMGLKPTYGRCSRYGLVAYASSLDHPGPFARNAQDLALLLQAMAGYDPRDSTSAPRAVPGYRRAVQLQRERALGRGLWGDVYASSEAAAAGAGNGTGAGEAAADGAGSAAARPLRIGVPKEYFATGQAGVDAAVAAAVRAAIDTLGADGAEVTEVSLPHTDYALAVYYILAPAECSSNLARFDGIRYGLRVKGPDLLATYAATRRAGFGAEVRRRIMLGTYVLSAGYYDAFYRRAQKARTLIRRDFEQAFGKVDVLVTPTSPVTAFKLGERTTDPVSMYLADVYTMAADLAGVPGLSVPCGFDAAGLPVGMQLMGPHFGEMDLLRVAARYEALTDWHTRRPPA
ncbi:MAG TPA: amidase family protein [Myxococcota bacterium]|jgi:aspartyl-tRNA(Asn)/glutamyl-tRNA(Gln) amidotransferase subunit A|nr:amidase family protein [Myxococcota bacterium]